MTAIRASSFLRRVLVVDAVFSGVSGIAMVLFAELLAGSIVVSGRVRADNLPTNPNARKVEAYYGR